MGGDTIATKTRRKKERAFRPKAEAQPFYGRHSARLTRLFSRGTTPPRGALAIAAYNRPTDRHPVTAAPGCDGQTGHHPTDGKPSVRRVRPHAALGQETLAASVNVG